MADKDVVFISLGTEATGKSSVAIHLFGATVTSWKIDEKEQIFLSDKAVLDGSKAIRGGIPLVFPQFGRPDEGMPQHGFARSNYWALEGVDTEGETEIRARFTLSQNQSTLKVWPFCFKLTYLVTLRPHSLVTSLEILNTDTKPLVCQALLHSYLRVRDIHHVVLKGFTNIPYIEKVGWNTGPQPGDPSEGTSIASEVDRIYTPGSVQEAGGEVEVELKENEALMTVSIAAHLHTETAFKSCPLVTPVGPDCVLWNGWVQKIKALADMQDEAWRTYVCIEPGLVSEFHTVVPRQSLVLSQTLTRVALAL